MNNMFNIYLLILCDGEERLYCYEESQVDSELQI